MDLVIPIPKLKERKINSQVYEQATKHGLDPIIAKILAARPINQDHLIKILDLKLQDLLNPSSMADMQLAANRICQAIANNEIIGIETDHDCDGQTSHAILKTSLIEYCKVSPERIRSYIGHRLQEGYGLSAKLAARIIADQLRPTLIITADNGSSDEARIKTLKDHGIDVIVTDHHQIPVEGIPQSAYACVNPTREDCNYADKYIAGCMVAWLLMIVTRNTLIARGLLPSTTPSLKGLLDFVAVGTIADCVSMAKSINNRIVVRAGLELINKMIRPCWQALRSITKAQITAEDLGFLVGPLLNSDGRLKDAFGSVNFLLADNLSIATEWINHLTEQNQQRKQIQRISINKGLQQAAQQAKIGNFSLVIYLPEGHSGVHGISASRVKDLFGRPTVFLAPKVNEEQLITGSVRGIEGFNVGSALRNIALRRPGMFLSYGGHSGAGGITLGINELKLFSEEFEQEAKNQLSVNDIGPVIYFDPQIDATMVSLNLLDQLKILEPFGREFEPPLFKIEAILEDFRIIGDGTHARVVLNSNNYRLRGVWFSFRQNSDSSINFVPGALVECAFIPVENIYQGLRRAEIQIKVIRILT